jgi:hypothetical protein
MMRVALAAAIFASAAGVPAAAQPTILKLISDDCAGFVDRRMERLTGADIIANQSIYSSRSWRIEACMKGVLCRQRGDAIAKELSLSAKQRQGVIEACAAGDGA